MAEPTKEEFHTWPTVERALLLAQGRSFESKQRWIMSRLKTGALKAVASQAGKDNGDLRPLAAIPKKFWAKLPDEGQGDFWEHGDAVFDLSEVENNGGLTDQGKIRYLDVRIDPIGFGRSHDGARPDSTPANNGYTPERPPHSRSEQPPVLPKGGRPRKGWWDDLWIEMIRRIQADRLNPKSAAQLEEIMQRWCVDQGFSPGDSTLKPSASKLFKYLEELRGK